MNAGKVSNTTPTLTTDHFHLPWLGLNILCSNSDIHICNRNWSQLIALPRQGFLISNLLSKIVYFLLAHFFSKQIRGPARVYKNLVELHERNGRLFFEWEIKVSAPQIESQSE